MSAPPSGAAPHLSRLPHPITAREFSRRGELAAAAAVALLLVHLLFAQLTLVLAVTLWLIDRLVRWRPEWLAVPAAVGVIWALAIGPGQAAAGFTAGPGQVASYLTGLFGHPAALLHFSPAYAGLTGWLPRQLPLALIAAAAEVALLNLLRRRRELRWGPPAPYRPGLIVGVRRRYTAARLAAGGVVSSDGACLGLERATGRPVTIGWPEAERGVLIAGSAPAAVTESGVQLAWAAIRRRKAVIVIELTGDPGIAAALGAACAEAAAPLRSFGPDGPGCYEPLHGSPARTAALVLDMIDWSQVGDAQRRACTAYLTDACAIAAAAPAGSGLPVLDDLAGLLQPDALRARAARVPGYHPRRAVLADRAAVSASQLAADPAAAAAVAGQLARLRAGALGRWLCSPGGQTPPSPLALGQALRDRAVVLFALDWPAHRRSARMIAALAGADLLGTLTELQSMAVRTDCLVWISGCEALPEGRLAELVSRGSQTGAAVLLSTASAQAAAALADQVGVIMTRGPADASLAGRLAELAAGVADQAPAVAEVAGTDAGGPLIPEIAYRDPDGLTHRGPDALALLVRRPRPRYLPACQAVPVVPGGPVISGSRA
jgi:hypothetical protein